MGLYWVLELKVMGKNYINKDAVISIHLKYEIPCFRYFWCEEEKPKKHFFSFLCSNEIKPAGYYTLDYEGGFSLVDEDTLKKSYKVYSRDERIKNNVVYNAKVIITLSDGSTIELTFNSNEEMESWVDTFRIGLDKLIEIKK